MRLLDQPLHRQSGTLHLLFMALALACKAESAKPVISPASLPVADTACTPPAQEQQQLIFRDAPLRTVLPQLGCHFDLQMILADTSLSERRLTASFREDADTAEVLALLGTTLAMRFERVGRVVRFSASTND